MTQKKKISFESASHGFLQMLHHLGWSLSALDEPQPLKFGAGTSPRAHWQTAPLPDGGFLLFVFLQEPLPNMDASFKAYEDFAPLHSELRAALREYNLTARHLLLIDPHENCQLLDLTQEDLLLDAHGEKDVVERLLPLLHLNKLAAGSLNSFPRKSLSQRARELHDWNRLWSSRLGAAAGTSPAIITSFFHWLYLCRLVEERELVSLNKVRFTDYGLLPKPLNPVRYLRPQFQLLCNTWNMLQGSPLGVQEEVLRHAHEGEQLVACLQSFSRLSRSKFSAQVLAEAFSDEELRKIGWRHSIIEKEEQATENPSRWLTDPKVVDLDAVGFTGLLRQFDIIIEDLRQMARENTVREQRGERPGVQMDFFGVEPPPFDEEDVAKVALQLALKVRTTHRDRGDLARLVLLAHSAEWYARTQRTEPIFPFPRIEIIGAPTIKPKQNPILDNPANLN